MTWISKTEAVTKAQAIVRREAEVMGLLLESAHVRVSDRAVQIAWTAQSEGARLAKRKVHSMQGGGWEFTIKPPAGKGWGTQTPGGLVIPGN